MTPHVAFNPTHKEAVFIVFCLHCLHSLLISRTLRNIRQAVLMSTKPRVIEKPSTVFKTEQYFKYL